MKTLVLLGILFLHLLGFQKEKETKINDFYQVNYETLLKNKETIGLSRIASKVEYINLETKDECLLWGGVKRYSFTEDFIFISNKDHILKFSREGKFIRKIGSPGRGPGEIDLIVNMSILPQEKLIIVQTNVGRKLLYFTFDGEFIKTVSFTSYAQYVKVLNDGNYLTHDDGGSGKNKFTFCLVNEKMDTLSFRKNYNHWVYKSNSNVFIGISYPQFYPYYESGGRNYFKTMYNDTIFSVVSNKIIPSYYIDLGKYKLPNELRPERLGPDNIQRFYDKRLNYYFSNVFQASDKLFLTSYCYGKNPQNCFLFEPEKKVGYLLMNKNGVSTGFINDWDGGLDFWPLGSLNDKQIYMPINIISIQKELDHIKSNQENIKYSEKKQQLIKMITELDPSNNPIIMIVTLK